MNPTTVRAITSSIGTSTEVASLKVCGSKSSKEVVISTPAAKAPRTPMFFLRLAAKLPPNNVEKQVTTAKRTALKFIQNYVSDSGYLIFIVFPASLFYSSMGWIDRDSMARH